MRNITKFYKILEKARTDEVFLILVITKIMPLINKNSLDTDKKIDEDLRSELIEYAINIVKSNDFADKLRKNEKF